MSLVSRTVGNRDSHAGRHQRARSACLAFLLALLLTAPAHAQGNDPADNVEFDHLSVDEGLSQVTVETILQDRSGFMWFGTMDGLNRYDGYDFTVYKYDAADPYSLGGNAIQVLYEDTAGMLWIGTDGGGLNVFDPATERFTRYLHDPDDPHSLGSDSVFEIYEDRAGTLWVGTFWGGGLHKFERATGQFTRYEFNQEDPDGLWGEGIFVIHEDQRGVLWIGTEGHGLGLSIVRRIVEKLGGSALRANQGRAACFTSHYWLRRRFPAITLSVGAGSEKSLLNRDEILRMTLRKRAGGHLG